MKNPKTAEVHGVTARLFRDSTPPIYVTPGGVFAYRTDQRQSWVRSSSLAKIDRELGRAKSNNFKRFKVMIAPHLSTEREVQTMRVHEIVAFDRHGGMRTAEGRTISTLGWNAMRACYVLDRRMVKAVDAMLREQADYVARTNKLILERLKTCKLVVLSEFAPSIGFPDSGPPAKEGA